MKKTTLLLFVLLLQACAPAVVPAPTVTSTVALPPTATASPLPTLKPSPTNVPNGPCDNPLVPLAIGNEWKYRVTTANQQSFYSLRSVERNDEGNISTVVEFTDEARNQSVQERAVCLDGAIENFPLFAMDMLFRDLLDTLFNTYHDNGIFAPAYQTFTDNGWILNWEAEYLTEDTAHIKNPVGGSDLVIFESSPMYLSFETDGSREPVTVPAGEFPNALKVSHSLKTTVTITLPTGGAGGHLTLDTIQWYEPYIGLVRAEVDKMSLTTGGQTFSLPMESTLELTEFNQGD